MNKAHFVLFFMIIFTSACTASQAENVGPEEVSENVKSITMEAAVITSPVPIEVQKSSTPEETLTQTESTIPTIEPTSTPIPETNRWHWVFSPSSTEIQVVNQFGEIRSIGNLDLTDVYDYKLFDICEDQSLFLSLIDDEDVVKLFGLEEIKDVNIPGSFSIDRYMFLSSIQVIGNFENLVYFVFATESSVEKDRSSYPANGPLYQLDLDSLSLNLIETNVYQDSLMDFRYYFFPSQDGSKLRYFKGEGTTLLINELDFKNGYVRTITQSTGSPNNAYVSEFGESFYLSRSDFFFTEEGGSVSFADTQSIVRLLRSGELIILPPECYGPCQIEVMDPLTKAISGNFTLPWSTQAYSRLATQLLPDGALFWVGASKRSLLKTPITSDNFPELENGDSPVFRLSSDGNHKLVGIINENEFEFPDRYPLSGDGRYILLKSPITASYYIYDILEDKEVLSLPEVEDWNYDFGSAFFYPEGMLVQFYASSSTVEYSQFLSFLHFDTSVSEFWEVPEFNNLFCPDIFTDGTIACWLQRENLNYDLVRFKPGSESFIPLIENVYVLESIE